MSSSSASRPQTVEPGPGESALTVRHLGRSEYQPTWRAMQAFTDARTPETPDELWLVEHPPVFTQGQSGKAEHVLAPGNIPVVQVDRGGQVTYHGPGQIVAYLMVDIRRKGLGVREFVRRIEQAIIDVLAGYSVSAERVCGAPGIYVASEKIASLGLRVRRGCTFHGLAFNVDMDLEPFGRINPCGFKGLQVTQLVSYRPVTVTEVERALVENLARQLDVTKVSWQ